MLSRLAAATATAALFSTAPISGVEAFKNFVEVTKDNIEKLKNENKHLLVLVSDSMTDRCENCEDVERRFVTAAAKYAATFQSSGYAHVHMPTTPVVTADPETGKELSPEEAAMKVEEDKSTQTEAQLKAQRQQDALLAQLKTTTDEHVMFGVVNAEKQPDLAGQLMPALEHEGAAEGEEGEVHAEEENHPVPSLVLFRKVMQHFRLKCSFEFVDFMLGFYHENAIYLYDLKQLPIPPCNSKKTFIY